MTIEFDTTRSEDEPKLQRYYKDNFEGALVYIRHLTVFAHGVAGLYAPYDQPERGQKHYNHRTFYIIDVDKDFKNLDDFEWVRSLI